MPAEEQRSGGMRSGAHGGLMCPLEKGDRGIETSGSGYLRQQIRGGRKGRAERQSLGQSPYKITRLGGLRQAGPGICDSKYVEDAKAARSVRVWDRVPIK